MDSVDLGLSSLAYEFLKTFCQLIFSRKRQSKFVEFLQFVLISARLDESLQIIITEKNLRKMCEHAQRHLE